MRSDRDRLISAARQLLAIEDLLGSGDLPADALQLPPIQWTAPAGESAPASAAGPATATPAAGDGLSPEQKAEALAELDRQEVSGCKKCPLCRSRTQTVFGEGHPDADLVFVGEAPGADEDMQGRPFVGRAGQLLDKMIRAMGLSREQVFICNMLKCRPPDNRNPAPEETVACWPYLLRQLEVIRPRVIVTLGNPATKGLLDTVTGITKMRGQFHELPEIAPGLGGTPVMPTFHPAYVLRNYSTDTRGKVWSDLKQVISALDLPAPADAGDSQ